MNAASALANFGLTPIPIESASAAATVELGITGAVAGIGFTGSIVLD